MALEDAPIVEVLQFDEADAYNHHRPISSLIRTQLLHLHQAEHAVVPANARTNTNINNLLTEHQAAEYIEKITALLHKHGAKDEKPGKKKAKSRRSIAAKSSKKVADKSKKKAIGESKKSATPKTTKKKASSKSPKKRRSSAKKR